MWIEQRLTTIQRRVPKLFGLCADTPHARLVFLICLPLNVQGHCVFSLVWSPFVAAESRHPEYSTSGNWDSFSCLVQQHHPHRRRQAYATPSITHCILGLESCPSTCPTAFRIDMKAAHMAQHLVVHEEAKKAHTRASLVGATAKPIPSMLFHPFSQERDSTSSTTEQRNLKQPRCPPIVGSLATTVEHGTIVGDANTLFQGRTNQNGESILNRNQAPVVGQVKTFLHYLIYYGDTTAVPHIYM